MLLTIALHLLTVIMIMAYTIAYVGMDMFRHSVMVLNVKMLTNVKKVHMGAQSTVTVLIMTVLLFVNVRMVIQNSLMMEPTVRVLTNNIFFIVYNI